MMMQAFFYRGEAESRLRRERNSRSHVNYFLVVSHAFESMVTVSAHQLRESGS